MQQSCFCERDQENTLKNLTKYEVYSLRFITGKLDHHDSFHWVLARTVRGLKNLRPTLKFNGAIDDLKCNIKYNIKGSDVKNVETSQNMVWQILNFKPPVTYHWGRQLQQG